MANQSFVSGGVNKKLFAEYEAIAAAEADKKKADARAKMLARLRTQAKDGATADAALFTQWDSEPDTKFDNTETFEQHKAAINANRAATGERKIY